VTIFPCNPNRLVMVVEPGMGQAFFPEDQVCTWSVPEYSARFIRLQSEFFRILRKN